MHRILNDRPIYIAAASRTPVGAFDGILANVSATALGAHAIRGALAKAHIDPNGIDEVFMGNVVTGGLGQAPAKQASVGAGIPQHVPATLVNTVCSSGVSAIMMGVNSILSGTAHAVVAGGMESRSMSPYLLGPKLPDAKRLVGKVRGHEFFLKPPKSLDGFMELFMQLQDAKIKEANIYDGLVCPFDPGKLMKDYAEEYAARRGWLPKMVDEVAAESHRKAREAQRKGFLDEEITPIGRETKDEFASDEELDRLRDWSDGVCTPYNCPGLADNAAAVVLADAQGLEKLGVTPMARLTGYARIDCGPGEFVEVPVKVVEELRGALNAAGMKAEWPMMEMNESFGMQLLLYAEKWPGVTLNVHGGAVAFRHPLGSAGVRILVTLLYAMKRYKTTHAVTAVCFGGGGAVALAVEHV